MEGKEMDWGDESHLAYAVVDTVEFGVFGQARFCSFARVHHCRMIASREMFADGFERFIGQLSHQEHCQASSTNDAGFARRPGEGIERDLEFFGDDLEEILAIELASTTGNDFVDMFGS